ncbi:MAG: M1 family aminopeptidase [Acidobacteriota bacterium]
MKRALSLFLLAGLLALSGATSAGARHQAQDDGIAELLLKLQQIMQVGVPDAYLDLLSPVADPVEAAGAVAGLIYPGITRAVVRERDRAPLEGTLVGSGYRLMLEIFIERGSRARISTWQFDVRRTIAEDAATNWRISDQKPLSNIDGLYRLELNATRQYRARNLVVHSEDLDIRMDEGLVFTADAGGGPTALVLLPERNGTFTFRPTPEVEREQVKLYARSDAIAGDLKEVFVRLNPADFNAKFASEALTIEATDPGALRRAAEVFDEEVEKSYGLDVGDLSRELWSLLPSFGDMVAELRTRRFDTLTYAQSQAEPEDISVFDRRRRRNISVYPSQERVARGQRFFDEDANASIDVLDYLVDVNIDPERQWLEGRGRLRFVVRETGMNSLTLRLAEPLRVYSVYSTELGRLLALRVRNQNTVVINLAGIVTSQTELNLVVSYGGRLPPAAPDRETVTQFPQDPLQAEPPDIPGEPSLLYSTRSYWYPQPTGTDYATAGIRITVPEPWVVMASGELVPGSPVSVPPREGRQPARMFEFSAPQPLRYLACVISKFERVMQLSVPLQRELEPRRATNGRPLSLPLSGPLPTGVFYDTISLVAEANSRQRSTGRRQGETAERIIRYYASLVGDTPYPSLALAVIERELPGGHSPAYLAVLHQPIPGSPFTWRNDPAAFPSFPEFFIAHELAHQWWGQAIGWKSYHEQWISEGFAQYFAALYARQSRGERSFDDLMRRMTRWARDMGDQGPVSLGYRLGHIRGEGRVFRALVYNKAAVVLHMLRRRLGDEIFFRALRRFYIGHRFQKAGTADVQRAFEIESGQDLERFFEGWIHSSGTPVVKYSWASVPGGQSVVLRYEQVGRVFDIPVTASITYGDRDVDDTVVFLREPAGEIRIPTRGDVRKIELNQDEITPVEVYRLAPVA